MNLRPNRRDPPDINLTPLIDVVFLLLIFFMVTTTFERSAELAIELPEASAEAAPRTEELLEVSIDAQGRFFVNGQPLVNTQPATLRQALEAERGDEGFPPLVINADAKTPHQAVVVVMDAARQLGMTRLRFATRGAAE